MINFINNRRMPAVLLVLAFLMVMGSFNFILKKHGSDNISVKAHPYGNQVKGELVWENRLKFQQLLDKYDTHVRMAAFETTLPDPLPGEEANVAHAADLLAGTILSPGKVFSMNLALGPYSRQRGFQDGPAYVGSQVTKTVGGGVCKIASTLYNVAILANLKIIERHSHGMQVPYVPPGQDATVSFGSKDLKFKNHTEQPIVIWADTNGNTLYIALYGRIKPPQVTWHHKVINRQEKQTVYRYDSTLAPSQEEVVIPGADGLAVKSWLKIIYPDHTVEEKALGVDYYRPMAKVVKKAPPQ
ncbi:VanW family protein [Metallumcola ferriviriculae]|uniref:VanW family protein n=1 Tax=Metallumcola ferriviriculae TaxID=3039180 RepID=A0AAU0UTQ4_9FIRM|nr:VanW family protein [Desulfitibacteraceae bacterium MK1]